MSRLTRRAAIKGMLSTSALAASFPGAGCLGGFSPDDEISRDERGQIAAVANAFMRRFDVPGLSVAIARQGRLVYEEAFGEANRQAGERLTGRSARHRAGAGQHGLGYGAQGQRVETLNASSLYPPAELLYVLRAALHCD